MLLRRIPCFKKVNILYLDPFKTEHTLSHQLFKFLKVDRARTIQVDLKRKCYLFSEAKEKEERLEEVNETHHFHVDNKWH